MAVAGDTDPRGMRRTLDGMATPTGLGPRVRRLFEVLVAAGYAASDHRVIRLAAGLAYYALFGLIPVLWVAVTLASTFFGSDTVSAEIARAISGVVGDEIAAFVLYAIDAISPDEQQAVVTVASLGVLLFAAALVFVAWKELVDLMWGIPRDRGVRAYVGRRIFGVIVVFGTGLLLVAVLFAQGVIAVLDQIVDIALLDTVIRATSSIAPTVLGAVAIGILFRYTPDVRVAWQDVWFPAILTMAMLVVGAWGYGIYLELYGFVSAGGLAGTLVLGLVFVYGAAAVLLFGMEVVREAHERRTATGRNIWA